MKIRSGWRDESGQSLVIVTIAMTVIVAIAAFSIDVGSWYAKHHQAQVVADAAALAAANCLASPGTGPSGSSCSDPATNPTQATSDAQAVAATYAAQNGLTLSDPSQQVQVNTTTHTVTVSASAAAPAFFSKLFGINSSTQSAAATASWTPGSSSTCTTPGSGCAAVFAMGSSCSSSSGQPGGSPIIFGGSGDTLNGLVHSNGSIYEAGGGSQTLGVTTFGNGSGCQVAWSNESGDTWGGSSTKPTVGQAPITTWPIDYTTIVTACGSGQTYSCNSSGTPSYCTKSAPNFTFGSGQTTLTSGNVWCAYGTGTPSNPSTWNGLIYFQSSAKSVTGNWFGGTIELGQNGFTLSAYQSSFPTLYATGSGNCSSGNSGGVCMTGGSQTINGSIFAPNGWVQFNGGSSSSTGFLEAQYIYFDGGASIVGSGPTSFTGSGATTGSDALTQ